MLLRTVILFITGVSGLRVLDNSVSTPSPGGVHLEMSDPIGMYTNPRRETAFAGVWASAVIDGIMASRSGSATVAPIPLRNVRRGRAFFKMIMMMLSSVISRGDPLPAH